MSVVMAVERVKDGLYDEYERLLIKRDQLYRDAGGILIVYTQIFGELINAVFEEKIACIKKKKEIAYYQMAINRGETIELEEMQKQVEKDMTLYYRELQKMTSRLEKAKKSKNASEIEIRRSKKIYRRIAKQIHPDINPWTKGRMELLDLWNRTVIAYGMYQAKELEELEVLAHQAMEQLGLDTFEVTIPNIEEKIERIEAEINEILTTEPYTLEVLICDEKQIAEKKESLNRELQDFRKYKEELDEALRQLMVFDGVSALWRGNGHDV